MFVQSKTLLIGTAAALTIAAAGPAAAASPLSGRVATGIGQYIAAQGNAALADIRASLVRELADRIQLYVPEPPAEMKTPYERQYEPAGGKD